MNIFDSSRAITRDGENRVGRDRERLMTIDITHDLFMSQLRFISVDLTSFDGCTNGNKLTTNFLSCCVLTCRYYHPGAELGIVESESAYRADYLNDIDFVWDVI
jgi:hypothetical protein